MIEYIPQIDFDNDTIANIVRRNQAHAVFMAFNGLTLLNGFTTCYWGYSSEELEKYVQKINLNLETGTLYPRVNVSILPSHNRMNETHEFEDAQVEKFILDVFEANRLYIKSDKVIFLLEVVSNYHDQIIRILKHMIIENKIDDPYVKTIYTHGPLGSMA